MTISMAADTTTRPVRVLWLMGSDRAKADTVSLVRWLRVADRSRLSMTVAFLSEPTGQTGPAGEFVAPDGSPQTIPDAIRRAGAQVAYLPGAASLSLFAGRALDRLTDDRALDVLVSVLFRADVAASRASSRKNRNWSWIVRAAGVGRYRRTRLYGGDWLDRRVYRRADGFITVSDAVRRDWSGRLGRPADDFQVIFNPAPPCPPADRLVPGDEIRRRLGVEPAASMILSAGRLDREKGVERLIDAAAACAASDARWVVLGEGPHRGRLVRRIARLGLASRFLLPGHSDDIWSHLRAADLFVLASHMEGCPNALLEAASAGLPIVATNVGAVGEILMSNQHALLVEPDASPADIASAVSQLLADRTLAQRLGDAARERVSGRFNPAIVAESHMAFFERIAGAQR
jgi:glycosyltransferase involved in cell wall biosynthesis